MTSSNGREVFEGHTLTYYCLSRTFVRRVCIPGGRYRPKSGFVSRVCLSGGTNWPFENGIFFERLLQVLIGFLKDIYFLSVRYRSELDFESHIFLKSLLKVRIGF